MAREGEPNSYKEKTGTEQEKCWSVRGNLLNNRWKIQTTALWDYLIVKVLQISNMIWQNSRGMDGPSNGKTNECEYKWKDRMLKEQFINDINNQIKDS